MADKVLKFEQKSPLFAYVVTFINGIGRLFFGAAKMVDIPKAPKKILIGKCDHLGDLMMITDFLMTVREKFPETKLTLIHGAWCKGLAERFLKAGMVDGLIQYSPMVLNRMGEGFLEKFWREWREFWQALREVKYGGFDLYFDLRPFSGNTLHIARMAKVPCRIGFGLREFGFSLNYKVNYSDTVPLGQLFNNALGIIGVEPHKYAGPRVSEGFWSKDMKLSSQKHVLLHVVSGNPIKNLSSDSWTNIIKLLLSNGYNPILVGAESDRSTLENLLQSSDISNENKAEVACGNLEKTLQACKRSEFAITVDSFVAHLVLAAQKKLFVIGPSSLKDIVARAIPLNCCHYLTMEENYPIAIKHELQLRRGDEI